MQAAPCCLEMKKMILLINVSLVFPKGPFREYAPYDVTKGSDASLGKFRVPSQNCFFKTSEAEHFFFFWQEIANTELTVLSRYYYG